MIVFVGNEIKLGGLIEVCRQRLNEEAVCIDEAFSIRKQENDILLRSKEASFIVYDTEQYLDDADQIISIIKRIYRANRAKPVILVPTSNPKNEIIKAAADQQLKLIVNTTLSMGEQKDLFEKCIAGFYDGNENEQLELAREEVEAENQDIRSFVSDLYDAKQREEEKENTVIIRKRGTAEVLLVFSIGFLKTVIGILIIILTAIGITTLLYSSIRTEFFEVLLQIMKTI